MKTNKTWYYPILLTMIVLTFSKNAYAQPGATKGTAISLTITPVQSTGWQSTDLDTIWYTYQATADNLTYDVVYKTGFTRTLDRVISLKSTSVMDYQEMMPVNDSTTKIQVTGLSLSETHYLALIFKTVSCPGCTVTPTAQYKINSVYAPAANIACSDSTVCDSVPLCQLVCNGSFEKIGGQNSTGGPLPDDVSQISMACGWNNANKATCDLYNTLSPQVVDIPCNMAGNEPERTGKNSYAGFYVYTPFSSTGNADYKESMFCTLKSALVSGKTYSVSFYLSLSDNSNSNTLSNNVGVAFSNAYSPSNGSNYNINSVSGGTEYFNTATLSKSGWQRYTYTYTPVSANEQYLVIGALKSCTSTTAVTTGSVCSPNGISPGCIYYYIDDISVTEAANFSVTPQWGLGCYPNITGLSVAPPNAAATYSWSSTPATNSLSAQTGTNIAISPTATTVYSVEAVGCEHVETYTVIPGVYTPTFVAASSSTLICPGTTVTLSASSTGLNSFTYTSSPPTASLSSQHNPTVVVSPSVTTTYTIIGSNNTPCADTYSAVITVSVITGPSFSISTLNTCINTSVIVTPTNSTTITFVDPNNGTYANPFTYSSPGTYLVYVEGTDACGALGSEIYTVNVVSSGLNPTLTVTPSQAVCAGTTKTLTVAGAATYTWATGSHSVSIAVTPTVTTTYTVRGATSCGSSTAAVTVSIIPVPSLTVAASPTAVCSGQSATLTASGASSYSWSTSAITSSIVVTPAVATTYTVSGSNACGTSTKTISITVTAPPTLTVAASPTVICAGGSSTLTASGASSYTWNPGTFTLNPVAVSPTVTTQYTVTGKTASGCIGANTVTVAVNPPPALAITGPSVACTGINISLIASGASGTYTWMPCTGTCTTTVKAFTPTVTTTYTLYGRSALGCIGSVTKTVLVNPRPVITVNSPTICPGGTGTFTASGGYSYLWPPSGINSPTMAYSPSVTTVYTFTAYGVTGAGTGTTNCYSNVNATINIASPPTVTASSATICAGSSANLTAGGASAYTWNPGSITGSGISVSPTVTTIYTVTGTSVAGCTATATGTVTVGPGSSFSVTSAASNNYPIIGSSVTVSATATPAGTYTYNWSPVTANTASATFTPTDNAVYTCNVTDRCGRTIPTSLCIAVESSLCAVSSGTVFNNVTIAATPTAISDATITVTGTLTISGGSSVTFNGCVIKMGSNSKIVVDPTSYLACTSSTLFSCEGMWYGIEAQSNSVSSSTVHLKVATIEDAYTAITADNGSSNQNSYIVSGKSNLNKNYIDISVKNALTGSGTYPLSLFSSSLTSNASVTSPGNSLKCSAFYSPTVRKRSYAGVYAVNANDMDIMNGFSGSDFNVVKNKDYGLYFTNTNANVYNINFSEFDGVQSTFCNPLFGCTTTYYGIAVRSESSGYLNVKPASSPTTGALTFTNVAYGILANATASVDVQYADFQNPAQYLGPFGQTGIGRNAIMANNATGLFRANLNTITQTYNAISSAYTSGPSGSFILSASENTISAGSGALTSAISLQSTVSFSPAATSMLVNGNSIASAANGISINNIKNGLRISSNAITMLYAASGAFAGIKLTGTENATIDANSISSTATTNTALSGIYLQLSPACATQCNSVTTVGQSVVFEGNCSSSFLGFFNNIMTNAADGMVLKNNGVIGAQGFAGTPTFLRGSSGNQWLGTFGNSKTLVMDAGSSAQYSNLIVRNNSNEYPQPQVSNKAVGSAFVFSDNFGIAPNVSPATMFTVTAANFNCPAAQTTGLRMAQADTIGEAYRQALKDSVLYSLLNGPVEEAVIVEETREINRAYVYNLLASGYSTNHAGLNAFYVEQRDSAVAQYHAVDSLLQVGNYYLAQNQNSQTSAETQIQHNQQMVNSALVKYGTDPQAGFTESELNDLMALANSCPLQQGTAVYQSRSLLSVLFNNALTFTENCEFEAKGERKTQALKENKNINSFSLYPNPNNGTMYLRYNLNTDALISIYDISGRILYQHELNRDNSLLHIQAMLSDGIYFYTVTDTSDKVLQTDKLIIMK